MFRGRWATKPGRASSSSIRSKAPIAGRSLVAEGAAITPPERPIRRENGSAPKSGCRRRFWRSMRFHTISNKTAYWTRMWWNRRKYIDPSPSLRSRVRMTTTALGLSPNRHMHALPKPAAQSESPETLGARSRPRMSTRNRLLFLLTGWLIVLMPFLFWWNTWFGRRLSEQRLVEYLQDDKHPRHIQHALVQLGERMSRGDSSVRRWYPDAVRLAAYPVEEVRNTDAWVMGQDTSGAGFHDALLKMLGDSSLTVRGNAALSLVRFGDATGRPQIIELLQPATVNAPQAGTVIDTSTAGTAIHQGGVVAKLQDNGKVIEVRSPISGRLRELQEQ